MNRRSLLIGLNASDELNRAMVCLLAGDSGFWGDAASADDDLSAATGVPKPMLEKMLCVRDRAEELAAAEEEKAESLGFRILVRGEPEYPRRLTDLALPPAVLYVRGSLPSGPSIAMVGSRRTADYGRCTAENFAREFASSGIRVVSGFSRGINAHSHKGALETVTRPCGILEDGRTVAVTACGLDLDYPRGQAELAAEIAEGGAMLSEFGLGSAPRPWRFPMRDRVVAALGDMVLVVQSHRGSGPPVVVHHAAELGRDVWVVPGPVNDNLWLGSRDLIAGGAFVAQDPREIIETLLTGRWPRLPVLPIQGSLIERLLFHMSPVQWRSSDEIARMADVGRDRARMVLLELELGGWVRRELRGTSPDVPARVAKRFRRRPMDYSEARSALLSGCDALITGVTP